MRNVILFVICLVLFIVFVGRPVSGATSVTTSNEMQPFGVGAEDDIRAMDVIQPTYSPMVTQHGLFIQNATAKVQ